MNLLSPWSVRWHPLEGVAFGLPHPVTLAEVNAPWLMPEQLARIDDNLSRLLEAPLGARSELIDLRTQALVRWAELILAVQRMVGVPASLSWYLQPASASPVGNAPLQCAIPMFSRPAHEAAASWVAHWLPLASVAPWSGETLETARQQAHEQIGPWAAQGLNTGRLVQSAERLRLPFRLLSAQLIQLGCGRRARWFNSSVTDRTSAMGVRLAGDKVMTARLLRDAGLPGAVHEAVTSEVEAASAAIRLGFPVVVKPADQEHGVGVAADLRTESAVHEAFRAAARHSRRILVERWAAGATHRFSVVEGEVIRVSRRIAGGVIGDGVRNVAELVSALQATEDYQRRVRRLGHSLVELDDEAIGLLRQDGRDASYRPTAGEYVRLRRRDNVNAGATNEVIGLARVHPDNLRLAQDAAQCLRLDFAGVDLIIEDVTRSWLDTGALICEVNSQPQIVAPEDPLLYDRFLSRLFDAGARVPVHLLVCADGAPDHGEWCRHLSHAPDRPWVSDAGGLWHQGRRRTGPFANACAAAFALLARPDVDSAVCLMSVGDIARHGLALGEWDRVTWPDAQRLSPREAALLPLVRQMVEARP